MKKLLIFVLCAVTAMSFAACSGGEASNPSNQASGTSGQSENAGGNTQIPSPFTDCDTLADAEQIAGFTLTLPDSTLEDFVDVKYRAMKDEMIELICMDADGEESLRVRKGAGQEDISGDYNVYDKTNSVTVGTREVTMKGADEVVFIAVWTDGDHSYAISASAGLSEEEMSKLVEEIQ